MSTQVQPDQRGSSDDPLPLQALRDITLRPGAFFAGLPRHRRVGRPALFALVSIAVSTVLAWLATGTDDGLLRGLVIPFAFDLGFFAVYLVVTHAMVFALLRDRSAGLSGTFRILAYGQVSQLVNWLPTLGLVIGLVYGSVLAVLGVRRVHGASVAVAVSVVALPLVIALCLVAAVLIAG